MAKKLSLRKLLIDRKSQKVLFAEAEKYFVDFLFSRLTLPVGSVVKQLKNHSMLESIEMLYESIENLSNAYIQPGQNKNMLLNPTSPSVTFGDDPTLLTPFTKQLKRKANEVLYTCSGSHNYKSRRYDTTDHEFVTDVLGFSCPSCKSGMTTEKIYVGNDNNAVSSSSVVGGGFVKSVVTYTVMDDLEVKPMSTISSIALVKRLNVKEVGHLEESVVNVGVDEGLAMLRASFQSKTVLTDTFLANGRKKGLQKNKDSFIQKKLKRKRSSLDKRRRLSKSIFGWVRL